MRCLATIILKRSEIEEIDIDFAIADDLFSNRFNDPSSFFRRKLGPAGIQIPCLGYDFLLDKCPIFRMSISA